MSLRFCVTPIWLGTGCSTRLRSQARCLSTGLALNSRASSVLWRSGRSRDLPALYQASSVCDVRTPTIGVRAFTSAAESKEDYDRLASSEIMQLLDAAGIDYRCGHWLPEATVHKHSCEACARAAARQGTCISSCAANEWNDTFYFIAIEPRVFSRANPANPNRSSSMDHGR